MYDPSSEYTTSVLVTGVTGAIGRAVARVISGYRVYGLIRDKASATGSRTASSGSSATFALRRDGKPPSTGRRSS